MGINPKTLDEYIGQGRVKSNIRTIITSLQDRTIFDDPMDHMLLCGPPGLGKTSLAELVAAEAQRPIIKLMGPQLKNADSLSILQDIEPWTFIFIDEIHALPTKVEEALYEPMDEFRWKGSYLNSFTLIGATTKEGLLSKPLRSRFTIAETLTLYSVEDLIQIVKRSATILKLLIDDKASEVIAKRSRGTPRIANQYLKRISYYNRVITREVAQNAMDTLRVDEQGVDARDFGIIKMIGALGGGPVGLNFLALSSQEDVETILGREPFLIAVGLMERSPRGKSLTEKGKIFLKDKESFYSSEEREPCAQII